MSWHHHKNIKETVLTGWPDLGPGRDRVVSSGSSQPANSIISVFRRLLNFLNFGHKCLSEHTLARKIHILVRLGGSEGGTLRQGAHGETAVNKVLLLGKTYAVTPHTWWHLRKCFLGGRKDKEVKLKSGFGE